MFHTFSICLYTLLFRKNNEFYGTTVCITQIVPFIFSQGIFIAFSRFYIHYSSPFQKPSTNKSKLTDMFNRSE